MSPAAKKKKILKFIRWFLYSLLFSCLAVALFVAYVVLAIISNVDQRNVKVEGIVMDENTNQRLANTAVVIYSYRFMSDRGTQNYDSCQGFDTLYLQTDHRGYYSVSIDYSCAVTIRVGGEKYRRKVYYPPLRKRIIQNIYLEST
ncbi:hypothetical protein [Saprospira grandis]|uniref:Carboxypeptidase regulatory-like domain-containing protein n=1 Tax=Saprospira grandis (strain Lewin) TaxID=984262 RepID=H6L556_SAPGL|nr:hypothetical protein [Saprospira grandis]AFC22928.1 hypothetical protein SGRA_0187 [Saprospira grandis str. Lewin]